MKSVKTMGIGYLGILLTYVVADAIWLGIVTRTDYTSSIGHLMRESVNLWPWFAFYIGYSACILRLAILNGSKPTYLRVCVNAFTLGLASYGAYNLTNYALLEAWPIGITLQDWIWGTSITTISAMVGFIAMKWDTYKESKQNKQALV